jgi:hypothetical protein
MRRCRRRGADLLPTAACREEGQEDVAASHGGWAPLGAVNRRSCVTYDPSGSHQLEGGSGALSSALQRHDTPFDRRA